MIVPVLARLTTWATEPDAVPLAVLYGEKGAGKTVIVQGVVHHLRQRVNSPAPVWRPHYFSLEHTEFGSDSVPTLSELLTESIRRHWVVEDRLPTGESLLRAAGTQPTLFVIDGFEWLLERWTAWPQRQTLMHELLKLVPTRRGTGGWSGPYAGVHTKVLVTLRPRYAYLLHEQLTDRHQYMELELL